MLTVVVNVNKKTDNVNFSVFNGAVNFINCA